MRLVNVYLVAYFLLILGALIALWSGGALVQLPVVWVALGLLIAVALGILLAVTTRKPAPAAE